MKYAIVENGFVSNIAVADAPIADNWIASEIARIGDKYENGQFIAPAPNIELEAAAARERRNTILAESDWTQLADAPVERLAWANYRQALRDVPDQSGFPLNIVWPVAP